MYKTNFLPNTPILSAEINQNFTIIQTWDVIGENLTSQIDGTKVTFTPANNFVPGTLKVFVDGVRATPGIDYQENAGATFTTLFTNPLDTNAILLVDYRQVL